MTRGECAFYPPYKKKPFAYCTQAEHDSIIQALEECDGNVSEAVRWFRHGGYKEKEILTTYRDVYGIDNFIIKYDLLFITEDDVRKYEYNLEDSALKKFIVWRSYADSFKRNKWELSRLRYELSQIMV